MDKLIKSIETVLSRKHNAVIAIDGCCASGKTSLTNQLAERFGLQIIHMDDFFLPADMRTEQRLSQAGGNVHYERFIAEVVTGIKSGKEFEYRVFNCHTGGFSGINTVSPEKPVIVEGAYALHPEIPDIFDLKIFFETDYETQLERILKRNGTEALEAFKAKWIPLENRYFNEFNIKQKCDILINIKKDRKA